MEEALLEKNINFLLKHKFVIGTALTAIVIALLIVAGGSKSKEKTPPAAPPPTNVEVAQVTREDVPIYSEWIGTLDGMVNAEIRAQVTGYLLRQNYKEGSPVRRGQLLFEIDPRPFQAALDQAKGDLAKAEAQLAQANSQLLQAQAQLAQSEANQVKAQLDVDRYTPLAKERAVTTQDLDNATQSNVAAKAQVKAANAGVETAKSAIVAANAAVEAAKATVKTAELNLSFTKITSPIEGIAGIASAQVGNLIQPTGGALTTVSTLDPIKVYFTLSEQEYLAYARRQSIESRWGGGARGAKGLALELVLADGSTYQQKGKFFVVDRQVDQKTGAIKLAGIFPNPGNALRPGQYARVRAITSMKQGALLVPQRAVTELQGSYRVAVVGNDNKVSIRPVTVGPRVELVNNNGANKASMWVIEDGLKPDDRVIAEGAQKVRPDAVVNPIPFR
jgi:membrane fusion protein (multidrug efflux system)